MSSASVAVTRPRRSRTAAYARAERERKSAVATPISGITAHVASARRQSRTNRMIGGAEERERALDERRHAVRDELVDRLDVVREPADDHARAVALVEAERQPLQVAEEPGAQVGEDALADPAGHVRLDVGHAPVREAGGDEDADDEIETAAVVVADGVVERVLGEIRRGERGRRRGEEREHGEGRALPVRGHQAPEQPDAAPGLAPGPVLDVGASLPHQVASGLVDSHATLSISPRASTASTNCCSSSPCS